MGKKRLFYLQVFVLVFVPPPFFYLNIHLTQKISKVFSKIKKFSSKKEDFIFLD